MKRALSILILIAAAAACSNGKKIVETTTVATTTTTTTEPATTTTALSLTVSQVASVVAGARDQLIDKATSVQIGCVAICDAVTAIDVRTLGVLADTLDVKLNALKIGTTQLFQIPPEIATLYDDTLTTLEDVSAASKAYTAACASSCSGTTSGKLTAGLYNAAAALKSQLAAWGPYL